MSALKDFDRHFDDLCEYESELDKIDLNDPILKELCKKVVDSVAVIEEKCAESIVNSVSMQNKPNQEVWEIVDHVRLGGDRPVRMVLRGSKDYCSQGEYSVQIRVLPTKFEFQNDLMFVIRESGTWVESFSNSFVYPDFIETDLLKSNIINTAMKVYEHKNITISDQACCYDASDLLSE